MDHEPVLVDQSATDELSSQVRATDFEVAANSRRRSSSTSPTSPRTSRELCATDSSVDENTNLGVAFQIAENSRITSVAAGSSSPVGQ